MILGNLVSNTVADEKGFVTIELQTKEQLEATISKLEKDVKDEKKEIGDLQSFCAKYPRPVPKAVLEDIKNKQRCLSIKMDELADKTDRLEQIQLQESEDRFYQMFSGLGVLGLESEQPKQWEPKENESYWTVDFNEPNGICEWYTHAYLKLHLKHTIVFKTKEEAQAAADKMLSALKEPEEKEITLVQLLEFIVQNGLYDCAQHTARSDAFEPCDDWEFTFNSYNQKMKIKKSDLLALFDKDGE